MKTLSLLLLWGLCLVPILRVWYLDEYGRPYYWHKLGIIVGVSLLMLVTTLVMF